VLPDGEHVLYIWPYDSNINISSDGQQIVFDRIEADRHTRHIWNADAARGVVTRLNAAARDCVANCVRPPKVLRSLAPTSDEAIAPSGDASQYKPPLACLNRRLEPF
jgi:hypothetical protein